MALTTLLRAIGHVLDFDRHVVMTPSEIDEFEHNHPGAHFVIGDFEIKCLKPEKYNL